MKRKLSVATVTVFLVLLLLSSVAYAALSGSTKMGSAPTVAMGSTAINYNNSVTYFRFISHPRIPVSSDMG
ncbi:MAG: hypothetical protein J7L77_07630 [Clostridiales bacterium]|nr:hypothetical protein [Clostridiales bacterium]